MNFHLSLDCFVHIIIHTSNAKFFSFAKTQRTWPSQKCSFRNTILPLFGSETSFVLEFSRRRLVYNNEKRTRNVHVYVFRFIIYLFFLRFQNGQLFRSDTVTHRFPFVARHTFERDHLHFFAQMYYIILVSYRIGCFRIDLF